MDAHIERRHQINHLVQTAGRQTGHRRAAAVRGRVIGAMEFELDSARSPEDRPATGGELLGRPLKTPVWSMKASALPSARRSLTRSRALAGDQ
jgi:hypothetical protein